MKERIVVHKTRQARRSFKFHYFVCLFAYVNNTNE